MNTILSAKLSNSRPSKAAQLTKKKKIHLIMIVRSWKIKNEKIKINNVEFLSLNKQK